MLEIRYFNQEGQNSAGNSKADSANDTGSVWDITVKYYEDLASYYENREMSFEADLFAEGAGKLRYNLKLPKVENIEQKDTGKA